MRYSCPDDLIELCQIYHHEWKNTHDQTNNHKVLQELQLNSSHHFYQIKVLYGQWWIFYSDFNHTYPDCHILPEIWYAIFGYCSWYSIFPNLHHIFSTLWLLLHLESETTYQHPINIIDIQRHDPHPSKNYCVNSH